MSLLPIRAASNDLVLERRLATPQAVEIVLEYVEDVVLVAARLARRVRGDQNLLHRPERRGGRQRLLDRHVERGAGNAMLVERSDERRLVDDAPARDVDEI